MDQNRSSTGSRSKFASLLIPAIIAFLSAVLLASVVYAHGGPLLLSQSDGIVRYISEVGLVPVEVAKGYDPDMGPDGVSIVYVTEDGVTGGPLSSSIWIKNTRTGSVRSLIRVDGRVTGPKWSPRGEMVAFMMFGEEDLWTLHVVGSDGSGLLRVAPPHGSRESFSPGSLVWHPFNESLIVHDLDVLRMYALDGSEEEKIPLERFTGELGLITSTDRFIPHPLHEGVWAFTMSVPGSPEFEKKFGEPNQALFIIDLDTGTRKRLTPDDMLATDIDWSRRGRVIYFSGYRDSMMNENNPFRIYSLDVQTLEITEICYGEQPSQ